jgi:hypothetical protein
MLKFQGDSYLELGAQWMHGEGGNPVCEFAKANNLLDDVISENGSKNNELGAPVLNYISGKKIMSDTENATNKSKVLFPTQNGEIIPTDLVFEFAKIFDDIVDEIYSIENDITDDSIFIDYVVKRLNEILLQHEKLKYCSESTRSYIEGLLVWRFKYECGERGCSNLYDLSLCGTVYDNPGDQCVELKHGYKPILDGLIASRSEEKFYERLKLNHALERILVCESLSGECEHCQYTKDPSKVCLVVRDVLKDCLVYVTCQHVICTMSLGFLKHNYKKLVSPSRYWPSDKIRAIERIGFGTINKVGLPLFLCIIRLGFYAFKL